MPVVSGRKFPERAAAALRHIPPSRHHRLTAMELPARKTALRENQSCLDPKETSRLSADGGATASLKVAESPAYCSAGTAEADAPGYDHPCLATIASPVLLTHAAASRFPPPNPRTVLSQ